MKAPTQRQLRVGEEIRHAMTEIMARSSIHDPDLIDVQVTFPEVRVSPDLKHASCYVMALGDGMSAVRTKFMVNALARHRKFIRGLLAKKLMLRHVPELHFKIDDRYEYTLTIDQLMATPQVKRDLSGFDLEAFEAEDEDQ